MKVEITVIIGTLATILGMVGVLWKIGHDVKEDWRKEVEERAKDRSDRQKFEEKQTLLYDQNQNLLNEILTKVSKLSEELSGMGSEVKANTKEIEVNKGSTKRAHKRLDRHDKIIDWILRLLINLKIPGAHELQGFIDESESEEEEDEGVAT